MAVSEATGAGDGELDAESFEARTAQVTEGARSASVIVVREGRSNLFSLVRINIVRRSPGKPLNARVAVAGKARGDT